MQTFSVYLDVDVVDDSEPAEPQITTRPFLYAPTADGDQWHEVLEGANMLFVISGSTQSAL